MLNVVCRSQIVGWIAKVKNHTIILVDDGIATGTTISAAIATLKKQQPRELVVAVPVIGVPTCEELQTEVISLYV